MIWTNERMELLQDLWLNGKSAAAISRELGQGISRNAVIGKASRLGLTGQVRTAPATFAKRSEPTSTLRCRPSVRGASAARHSRSFGAVAGASNGVTQDFPDAVVVPLLRRVTLEELEANMCRWPLGDPPSSDFRYCGAHKLDKTAYCAFHRRLGRKAEHELSRDRHRSAIGGAGERSEPRVLSADTPLTPIAATLTR